MTTDKWLRRRMSHTCVVQRDSGTAQSSSGQVTPVWADVGTRRPCRYVERSESMVDEARSAVMVKTRLLLMNGTSDVTVSDRIVRIWDPDDTVIHAGPFTVEELFERRDIRGRVNHLALTLERTEFS